MDLQHGRLDCTDGVMDGNGGMGIGAGIQNNTRKRETHLMKFVNDFSFYVGLVIMQFSFWKTLLQLFGITFSLAIWFLLLEQGV